MRALAVVLLTQSLVAYWDVTSSSNSSSNGAGDNETPQPSFLLPGGANFTVLNDTDLLGTVLNDTDLMGTVLNDTDLPFTVLNDTDLPGAQMAVKPGTSALDCAAQCLAGLRRRRLERAGVRVPRPKLWLQVHCHTPGR